MESEYFEIDLIDESDYDYLNYWFEDFKYEFFDGGSSDVLC